MSSLSIPVTVKRVAIDLSAQITDDNSIVRKHVYHGTLPKAVQSLSDEIATRSSSVLANWKQAITAMNGKPSVSVPEVLCQVAAFQVFSAIMQDCVDKLAAPTGGSIAQPIFEKSAQDIFQESVGAHVTKMYAGQSLGSELQAMTIVGNVTAAMFNSRTDVTQVGMPLDFGAAPLLTFAVNSKKLETAIGVLSHMTEATTGFVVGRLKDKCGEALHAREKVVVIESPLASRVHLRLRRLDDDLQAANLSTTNQTFLDETALIGDHLTVLGNGQLIEIVNRQSGSLPVAAARVPKVSPVGVAQKRFAEGKAKIENWFLERLQGMLEDKRQGNCIMPFVCTQDSLPWMEADKVTMTSESTGSWKMRIQFRGTSTELPMKSGDTMSIGTPFGDYKVTLP